MWLKAKYCFSMSCEHYFLDMNSTLCLDQCDYRAWQLLSGKPLDFGRVGSGILVAPILHLKKKKNCTHS